MAKVQIAVRLWRKASDNCVLLPSGDIPADLRTDEITWFFFGIYFGFLIVHSYAVPDIWSQAKRC